MRLPESLRHILIAFLAKLLKHKLAKPVVVLYDINTPAGKVSVSAEIDPQELERFLGQLAAVAKRIA